MLKSKILNIEALRFIFALAIVGFHVVFLHSFDAFGFSGLYKYFQTGNQAVIPFFIIAFFFVCLKYKPEQSIVDFVKQKWVRMAPAIIFVTLLFYIFHLFGFWGFDTAANIEQILLIHDWTGVGRWGQVVHPAWWCSEFLLMSVFYLGLRKTFSDNYIPFIIGICVFIGWRTFIVSDPKSAFMFRDMGSVLFSLGIGYFLAEVYKKYLSSKDSVNLQNSKLSKKVIYWTFIEFLMFYLIIQKLFFNLYSHLNYMLLVLCFVVLFYSFITNRGMLGRLLNNNVSAYLGKYSYAIFICHVFILDLCREVIFPQYKSWVISHSICVYIITLLSIFILAVISYYCIEQPIMKVYKKVENAKH